MATQIGSGSTLLATYIPDLTDTANVQTALKQLYYGTTGGTLSTTTGIYGALYTLYTGNPTLAGDVTVTGNLTVNGTTTTLNSNTLSVDDKNLELGYVSAGVVSTTGTIGTVSGSGPFTATITGMSSTTGLIPGQTITATAGTGNFGSGTVTVASIVSTTSITISSTLTFTAGTVTNITGSAASDASADGGGITLKGASDKTFQWASTGANWTSSENLSLATGKAYKINNVDIASGTGAALVLGANASTSLALGNTSGTTTLNGTVNIPNTFQLAGTGVTTTGTKLNYLTSATGTTGTTSTNIVFSTSPTITTPTIDTINTSLTTTGTAALWNTGLTTGTISIGGALTSGTLNIASGTAGAKIINIGTSTGKVQLANILNISQTANTATSLTITGTVILAKTITQSGQTAATTYTLDTGANLDTAFGTPGSGTTIDWQIFNDNTSTGIITIISATGHTISGTATVPIGAYAKFTTRRTATTGTYITYRTL